MDHVRPSAALTLTGARAAMDAALTHAETHDLQINVAVVDAGGTLLCFCRMDGAFTQSGSIAIDKARTSVGFGGADTADLYLDLSSEDAVIRGIANRPGIAAFGGAVPIFVYGELIGAVGVSGGSAKQDAEVAAVGVAAICAPPR